MLYLEGQSSLKSKEKRECLVKSAKYHAEPYYKIQGITNFVRNERNPMGPIDRDLVKFIES